MDGASHLFMHSLKNSVGEDINLAGRKLLPLVQFEFENPVLITSVDDVGIEIFVKFDLQFISTGLLIGALVVLQLASGALDGEETFLEMNLKSVLGNTGEGDREFQSGFESAGFESWAGGDQFFIHGFGKMEVSGFRWFVCRSLRRQAF